MHKKQNESTVGFGESISSERNISKLFKEIKEGRKVVNDNPGRPYAFTTDKKVEVVKKMTHENRRIIIIDVTEEASIYVGAFNAIFSDVLGMRLVSRSESA